MEIDGDDDDEDHGDDDSNYCICGKDKEKEMVANKGSSCSALVLLDLLFAQTTYFLSNKPLNLLFFGKSITQKQIHKDNPKSTAKVFLNKVEKG